jgi:asparagine synthase (glutamine-hydrolysing)
LPSEIVDRPKAGFKVPLDAWFRSGLRTMARDMLLSTNSFVASVFDRRAIEQLLDDHDQGRRDEAIGIWTLMSLEVWHEVHIAQRATVHPTPSVG